MERYDRGDDGLLPGRHPPYQSLKDPLQVHTHEDLPASLDSHKSCSRVASDIKLRDTCNYRGSLCYWFPRGKTGGRSLRPGQPTFCSREIPKTVREPVLAGFSESGLEVVVGPGGRPITEREIRGSTCLRVVLPRRRSPRRLGERRRASSHSALRLCRCLERHRPFSLDSVRLHLCSPVTSGFGGGGRCTEGGGRWSWPPSARQPPPGGSPPPVRC
ncbi:uncharacterized protein [Physeter macrocephalus]|uniref:Uncharacterized protein n=1 Tax=Physeter macrocephalus TaxID=9755 RepID=A0A9W2WUR3_PHYMC|nr:uncharacterized protein LOC129392383 [Physeter catodon]